MMRESPQRVYVATVGVFLGAGIVSLYQRLLGTGLPDVRGALGLGFDEAAWIPTAYNMALMFIGPFTVYLGGLFGARRVLLISATIYAVTGTAIPIVGGYWPILALQVVAGLASGTFYPLSLAFALSNLPAKYAIYAIGAYSMELLVTLSLGTHLEGWFIEHMSYRWIFWSGPALTLLMLLFVYLGVPNPPPRPAAQTKPNFLGFLYASAGLSLVFGVLEQGERLDWLSSPTIVAMLSGGAVLLFAAATRRVMAPNPLVNLKFLLQRNTLILGFGLFVFRFALLAILLVVPGFLGVVQGYRPLETGRVLLWSVVPILLGGYGAAELMRRVDARIVIAGGLCLVAVSALVGARLTSVWVDEDFFFSQILAACGLAVTLVGLVGMIAEQLAETGAIVDGRVIRPFDVLTFAAFFQTVRLFGGQVGTTVMQRFVTVREAFHSNRLGEHLAAGDFTTDERLRGLIASLLSASRGIADAEERALALLGAQTRRQAFTLAYADAFMLIAAGSIVYVLATAAMKPMKNYYDKALTEAPH